MIQLFHTSSEGCSRVVTETYSTSFASAIRLLHRDLRSHICNIYGFVRLADEIVDSFHEHDKQRLLGEFREETFRSIATGLSLNPILNSFQRTVNTYDIAHQLIIAFFDSMEEDLHRSTHTADSYRKYIYGSAEVVGLMCLHVFCEGDRSLFDKLAPAARSLGAAFQKVNFLRDMQADYHGLARVYFPNCDFTNFTAEQKKEIEDDIRTDFDKAMEGILALPTKSRFGVYVAYKYYRSLFRKIEKLEPRFILRQRIRIPNYRKALILLRAGVKNQLRLIG
jgi:phytoene/squalene synthetase